MKPNFNTYTALSVKDSWLILGAGTAEVVGANCSIPICFDELFNYRPHRPVAQSIAFDLPALRDRTQQPALIDAGRGQPGVDALLDPDGDGDGADAAALAFEVGQHPAPLSLLDGLDVKLGQLVPS
jgi:hypothetical protein